jgi:aminoglycoside phosphotransferase (APT) family kinase protein
VGLVWGDARPANVICDHESFDIIALLDWELAGIGVAESEIMWLQEMNWVRTEGAGLAPLPGFLSPSDSVALYEAKIGRQLQHLDWFAQLAATRVAILMHRYLRTQVNAGMIDERHKVLTNNSGSRRLDQYTP